MNERLVRRVVLAAVKGEIGSDGFIRVHASGATDRDISLAIKEAHERGIAEGLACPDHDRPWEWKLIGFTAKSEEYLRQSNASKKLRRGLKAALRPLLVFMAWLIPVLISIWKK